MLRSTASKVMWVGRATVFLVGLAVILALVFGVATTALGANGQFFLLGRFNAATALTKLTGNVNGAAMQVANSNTGTNDTALNLSVQAGEAPMAVNSKARVANLNAAFAGRADSAASADNATNAQNVDKLDNKDSSEFLGANQKAVDSDKLDGKGSDTYLPGDLPPGRTVRGTFKANFYATEANQRSHDALSFGYRLPSSPNIRFIKEGEAVPAGCSGTPANPEADPGYLCVFETYRNNTNQSRGANLMADGRNGAVVYEFSASAGESTSMGTWAVTAATG